VTKEKQTGDAPNDMVESHERKEGGNRRTQGQRRKRGGRRSTTNGLDEMKRGREKKKKEKIRGGTRRPSRDGSKGDGNLPRCYAGDEKSQLYATKNRKKKCKRGGIRANG